MDEDEINVPGFNVEDPNAPVGNQSQQEPVLSANPILNEVAPDHRAIVAPYLQKWEKAATQKFMEYADKYKPYEELGSVEELQKYRNFVANFRANPEKVFQMMWNGYYQQFGPENFVNELAKVLGLSEEEVEDMAEEFYDQSGQQPQGQQGQQQGNPYANLPPEVLEELEASRQFREQTIQQQQEREEMAQLDSFMQEMHNKYGEFNDDYILLQLSKHGNPELAIQEWNKLVGKDSQKVTRQAPIIPGGQGGVPSGQVDVTKLKGTDRKNAVLAMLNRDAE